MEYARSQALGKGKIFCIGFQKTGTSSMGRALEALGYRVCGAVGLKEQHLEDNIQRIAFDVVANYDAFQDNPWPILFPDLDRQWPNSRFILTLRQEDSWLRSVVRHFGSEPRPMLRWIYGVGYPKGNEQIFLDRYRQHKADVLDYFKDRPNDLLVLNIESEDLWTPICDFLSIDLPHTAFPHANKGGTAWKLNRYVQNRSKRMIRKLGFKIK